MSECYYKPDKKPEKCDFCDYNFDFKCCDHKDKYDYDGYDKCDYHKKEEKCHVCYIPVVCCKCEREKKDPCKDRY